MKRHERRRNLRYRTSTALSEDEAGKIAAKKHYESAVTKEREAKSVDEYAKDLSQWLKKMKCTGVTGVRLESFGDIKIGISEEPLDPDSPTLEPYPKLWQEKYTYKGYKDELGRPKGKAFIGNVQLFVDLIFILYARWRFKTVSLQRYKQSSLRS